MLDVAQNILTQVKTVLVIPASAIFTEDQLDGLVHAPNIIWGDMYGPNMSLLKPSRFIAEDWSEELNDLFRLLDAVTVYIDLEN